MSNCKPEKKNYEVLLTGYVTVAVEQAGSSEEAIQIAEDTASCGDFNLDIMESKEVKDESWETAFRCCDVQAPETE